MPLRVAMPVRVISPTSEATDSVSPASHIAATLPTQAMGMLPMISAASRAER